MMAGWNPFDARQTFDAGSIDPVLLAAGGRLILRPQQSASEANWYAGGSAPPPPPPLVRAPAPGPNIGFTLPQTEAEAAAAKQREILMVAGGAALVGIIGLVIYKKKIRKR